MNYKAKTQLSYSLLGIGILYAFKKTHFELTKNDTFNTKMRLVFPNYQLDGDE